MIAGLLLKPRMAAVCAAICVAAAVGVAGAALAQNTGVPNALQGFSQNRDKPVQIEAASLEVRDKDKIAVFTGNVVVTQGDTVMRCKELHVFYDQEDTKGGGKSANKGSTMKAAQPGPGGKQSIRRLEARGGVVVTTKDQTATGATGIFEMKTNTVTLAGGVVVTQGTNVLKGERLVVDLTTSHARVEGGRVQGLFSTNKDEKGGKDDKQSTGSGAQSKDGKASAQKGRPAAGSN